MGVLFPARRFLRPASAEFFWRAKTDRENSLVQLLYLTCPQRSRIRDRRQGVPVRAAAVFLCLLIGSWSIAAEPTVAPEFTDVTRAVEAYFASLDDYEAGDLVSRSQIEEVLAGVKDVGWDVPGAGQIVQRGLADNSFLVVQLSTPAGRKFMRKIATQPGAYARLDRLSSISHGRKIVSDLIHTKGGYELVIYLATTKGGHLLGQQMAATQNGVDLNKPTGRIYTADDLIAELRRRFEGRSPK